MLIPVEGRAVKVKFSKPLATHTKPRRGLELVLFAGVLLLILSFVG